MKQPYDPKLREAAEEFRAICQKYDCVGVVLFVSPTNAEFVNKLDASWSCMKMEQQPDGKYGVRIRTQKDEYKGGLTEQKFVVESTAHAMTSIHEWTRQTHELSLQMLMLVRQKWGVLWKTWMEPDSVPGDGK